MGMIIKNNFLVFYNIMDSSHQKPQIPFPIKLKGIKIQSLSFSFSFSFIGLNQTDP